MIADDERGLRFLPHEDAVRSEVRDGHGELMENPLAVAAFSLGRSGGVRAIADNLLKRASETQASWALGSAGLLIGMGPVADAEVAMRVFAASIPYNVYAWLAVLMVGAVCARLIPEFGPMRLFRPNREDNAPIGQGLGHNGIDQIFITGFCLVPQIHAF